MFNRSTTKYFKKEEEETEEYEYHLAQPKTRIPPFIVPPNFGKDERQETYKLQDKNNMKVRIYLDLLQFFQEEEKQFMKHSQKSFYNHGHKVTENITRNLDEEHKWYVDILISKSNVYDLAIMFQS